MTVGLPVIISLIPSPISTKKTDARISLATLMVLRCHTERSLAVLG